MVGQQVVVETAHLYVCPVSVLNLGQTSAAFFWGKWKLIVLLSKYLNRLKLPRYFNSSEIFQYWVGLRLDVSTIYILDPRSLGTNSNLIPSSCDIKQMYTTYFINKSQFQQEKFNIVSPQNSILVSTLSKLFQF